MFVFSKNDHKDLNEEIKELKKEFEKIRENIFSIKTEPAYHGLAIIKIERICKCLDQLNDRLDRVEKKTNIND